MNNENYVSENSCYFPKTTTTLLIKQNTELGFRTLLEKKFEKLKQNSVSREIERELWENVRKNNLHKNNDSLTGITSKTINKVLKIKQLTECNEKAPVSIIRQELGLSFTSGSYIRELMQKTAFKYGFTYFQGIKGQESFLMQNKPENKAMNAYIEVYQELMSKALGTTIGAGTIAKRFDLNGQELQSVISKLCQHSQFYCEKSKFLPDYRIKIVK